MTDTGTRPPFDEPAEDEPFEEDPRYRVAEREMYIAVGYWVAFTVVVTATAWLIGGGKKAEELTFVLGFPDWFFWSVPVACLVFSGIAYVLVHRYFTDMPLSADEGAEADRAGR
ncbi:putative membrane protein YhdT [Murinocardiopsis flavida]|uniref:Putative membrane protein YhdT n=1 Tax=Murinocardiopsis flavida TaxID=645275 RepID=A0A2P8CZ17_9ACTN|nr:YhdT family protein [Murinocardiopsis flavida]PSK90218.1 putative membrane protein YhdT [Murinocardiopsis flavida]